MFISSTITKKHFTDVPETHVRLGTSLEPDSIREGTDVYFDCLVSAHPAAYKVEWRHNVSRPETATYMLDMNTIIWARYATETTGTVE